MRSALAGMPQNPFVTAELQRFELRGDGIFDRRIKKLQVEFGHRAAKADRYECESRVFLGFLAGRGGGRCTGMHIGRGCRFRGVFVENLGEIVSGVAGKGEDGAISGKAEGHGGGATLDADISRSGPGGDMDPGALSGLGGGVCGIRGERPVSAIEQKHGNAEYKEGNIFFHGHTFARISGGIFNGYRSKWKFTGMARIYDFPVILSRSART